MCNTKSEPECKLQTVGDDTVSVGADSRAIGPSVLLSVREGRANAGTVFSFFPPKDLFI